MLIGLSVSRCIADILDDKVKENDVLVIIGGTKFVASSIPSLITGYRLPMGPWVHYEYHKVEDLVRRMYDTGKIHQPREFIHGYPYPSDGQPDYWMQVFPRVTTGSAATKNAWDRFVLLSQLDKQ